MKTTMQVTEKAKKYLDSLPKIYLIGSWAHYGVMEFPYSGTTTKDGTPLVWKYEDHNGTHEEYVCIPATQTTTGFVYSWTTSKNSAKFIADKMEFAYNEKIKKENNSIGN